MARNISKMKIDRKLNDIGEVEATIYLSSFFYSLPRPAFSVLKFFMPIKKTKYYYLEVADDD